MAGVRANVGVPVAAQFNLGADVTPCAPIVVNSSTGRPYTLTSADVVTAVALGTGTASGTNTGDQTSVSGNAGTATKLATARNINGVAFDGSADITVTADSATLTGAASSWTPANPQVTLTVTSALHKKIGPAVILQADITWPANADGNSATITGVPISSGAQAYVVSFWSNAGYALAGKLNGTTIDNINDQVAAAPVTNANLSGKTVRLSAMYFP